MISDEERGPGHALLIVLKDGPEWLVHLAELILLSAAFQLVADKTASWVVDGFSWVLYAFTLMHAVKPMVSVVVGPNFRFRKEEIYQRRIFALIGGFLAVSWAKAVAALVKVSVGILVAAGF